MEDQKKDRLDKMKPMRTIYADNNQNSVVYDRLENKLEARPLIVFHDDEVSDKYFCLKFRAAKDSLGQFKKKYPGEIFVGKSDATYSLLTKDSYVDTTQIYRIDSAILDNLKDQKVYLHTKFLDKDTIKQVYENLLENILEEPPLISICDVNGDQNSWKPEMIYSNKDLLDLETSKKIRDKKASDDEIEKFKKNLEEKSKETVHAVERISSIVGELYNEFHYENYYLSEQEEQEQEEQEKNNSSSFKQSM